MRTRAARATTQDVPPAPETPKTVATTAPAPPRGTVIVSPVQHPLSADDLLRRLYQNPQGGFVRLESGEACAWLRFEADTWREPGDRSHDLRAFVTSTGGVDVQFSPVLTTSPTWGGPPCALTCLWCRIRLRQIAPQKGWPAPGVDRADYTEVLRKLSGVKPAPSVILTEGPSVSAFWVLATPIAVDDPRGVAARRALAVALGGDLEAATTDVTRVLFLLPGVRASSIFPAHDVLAHAWCDEAYPIERFTTVHLNGGPR